MNITAPCSIFVLDRSITLCIGFLRLLARCQSASCLTNVLSPVVPAHLAVGSFCFAWYSSSTYGPFSIKGAHCCNSKLFYRTWLVYAEITPVHPHQTMAWRWTSILTVILVVSGCIFSAASWTRCGKQLLTGSLEQCRTTQQNLLTFLGFTSPFNLQALLVFGERTLSSYRMSFSLTWNKYLQGFL